MTSVLKVGYGVGLVVRQQIAELVSLGYKNIYVCSNDVDGFKETPIANSKFFSVDVKWSSAFEQEILELSPDYIIVHTPPFFEHVARLDCDCIKVAYDHGEPFPEFFKDEINMRRRKDKTKKEAIQHFNSHISISQFIHRTSDVKNSTIIYNGSDHVGEVSDRDINKELNLSPDTILISSLSRIGATEGEYKGYDLMIELKKRLEAVFNKDIKFCFMGRAVPKENRHEIALRNNGFLLLENVDEQLKIDILSRSDIFVSASIWEGFNLPLIEAQVLGTLSVAFAAGAHNEVCPFTFITLDEMVTFLANNLDNTDQLKVNATLCADYVTSKFTWKNNAESLVKHLAIVTNKDTVTVNIKNAVDQDLALRASYLSKNKVKATVEYGFAPKTFQIKPDISNYEPLISIIIPNKDHVDDLSTCITSILERSTYQNYEIVIMENGSVYKDIFDYYDEITKRHDNIKVHVWNKGFNYSALNNFGVSKAKGDLYLFLNNDTEVISPDWMERMYEYFTLKNTGIVGTKLYFPDRSIQHGGLIMGIRKAAANVFAFEPGDSRGYMNRLMTVQNLNGVTAACMLVSKAAYEAVKGFDEKFVVAFNDVDFCLRVKKAGYEILWTPYAELYHHEKKSRGNPDTPKKLKRFQGELSLFQDRWSDLLSNCDYFYNPNLTHQRDNFSFVV